MLVAVGVAPVGVAVRVEEGVGTVGVGVTVGVRVRVAVGVAPPQVPPVSELVKVAGLAPVQVAVSPPTGSASVFWPALHVPLVGVSMCQT